jgi:LysR family transcriptional regulator, transcriptional activator of the cysJI operon
MIENFRIRVFRAVAHHLSVSRAAEGLLLPHHAVAQQITALEDEFGVSLFDRGGGRIVLTPGGGALLPFADQMKTLGEEAIAAVVVPIVNIPESSHRSVSCTDGDRRTRKSARVG